MSFIGSDNAIAWAHFRLRGGWRQSLKWAVGFFILASIGAFFMVRGDPIGSETPQETPGDKRESENPENRDERKHGALSTAASLPVPCAALLR